jgi:hypothetical protein
VVSPPPGPRHLPMHNPFDHLAKKVGKEALDASGPTIVQYEISRDAQHADLRHDPDPVRGAERVRLGLLGRIAEVLCLIEIFGHAPDGAEVRACLSKHFAHWEECAVKARARNRRRKQKDLPPERIVTPFLWIIVATVSAPMLLDLEAKAAVGWPAGVYFHGGDLYRVGIVVASELPRDRTTLLVRIMAAGSGLADALVDLAALPEDAHERTVAEGIVVHLQDRLAKKSDLCGRSARGRRVIAGRCAAMRGTDQPSAFGASWCVGASARQQGGERTEGCDCRSGRQAEVDPSLLEPLAVVVVGNQCAERCQGAGALLRPAHPVVLLTRRYHEVIRLLAAVAGVA